MSLLSEFRDFAVKGNVIDLAVGVIIGRVHRMLLLVSDIRVEGRFSQVNRPSIFLVPSL